MLERPSIAGITISSGNKSWKEEFQVAIQKLSLAEAAQDAQENGMVLSCRESERAQIMSFLRKAISGLVQSNSNDGGEEEEVKNLKSSLFIAGPPGTGKVSIIVAYDCMASVFFSSLNAFA
jgi:Cdc6-like AAA superfamily ATPase